MTIKPTYTSSSSSRHISRRRSSSASTSSLASKTQKRTYVEHNYQDHYSDPLFREGIDDEEMTTDGGKRRGPRGGVVIPFPERLNTMLSEAEENDFEDVVSWQPHGRCFIVHQPKKFVEEVMPKYFRQSKLTSFQRQVNLYGFRRLTAGTDRGGYYHEMFLRGRCDLHKTLFRIRVKGTGFKSASSPATEPNFYSYEHCTEEGPSQMMSRLSDTAPDTMGSAETADVYEHETPRLDFITGENPVDPIWKALGAPAKMVVTPASSPSSIDNAKYFGSSRPSMTLSSMAHCLVHTEEQAESSRQHEPCTVTPESRPRQLIANGLEQALAMARPMESPLHSAFPSTVSLADTSGCSMEDLMVAPLPGVEDFRLETFDADVEALLCVDALSGEDIIPSDPAGISSNDSFDPLFLLDELVIGPVC